jgi:peptidoglycan/xylan/chitin deacetylase (PgdA/CDA1 family)
MSRPEVARRGVVVVGVVVIVGLLVAAVWYVSGRLTPSRGVATIGPARRLGATTVVATPAGADVDVATTVLATPVTMATPPSTGASAPASSAPPPAPPESPAISAGPVGVWPAPGEVALTFDDGPGEATPAVLDILERYRIPATFFVLGRLIRRHHDLLARMHSDGDSVENHTWDHPHLTSLPAAGIRGQLSRTSAAITAAIGVAPLCFRPPYLDTNAAVAGAAAPLHQILANVNPADYSRPDPAVITERVLASATGPALVVGLHDGGDDRSRTVAALPAIIDGLTQAGYQFVALCAA